MEILDNGNHEDIGGVRSQGDEGKASGCLIAEQTRRIQPGFGLVSAPAKFLGIEIRTGKDRPIAASNRRIDAMLKDHRFLSGLSIGEAFKTLS